MMRFTDFTGLFGWCIAIAALAAMWLPVRDVRLRFCCIGLLLAAVLIPWQGAPLLIYPRGVFGDLSVASLMLLSLAIAARGGDALRRCRVALGESRTMLLGMLVLFGLLLYPMALGFGMYDPYQMGYASMPFIIMLATFGAFAIWQRALLIAAFISLAMLTWRFGWYESDNLWDYLIDPLAAIYASAVFIRCALEVLRYKIKSHLRRRKSSG